MAHGSQSSGPECLGGGDSWGKGHMVPLTGVSYRNSEVARGQGRVCSESSTRVGAQGPLHAVLQLFGQLGP